MIEESSPPLKYAPTGFEEDLPYTIALVRFDDDLQVFGRVARTIQPEELAVGMELIVCPLPLANDRITYEFRRPKRRTSEA